MRFPGRASRKVTLAASCRWVDASLLAWSASLRAVAAASRRPRAWLARSSARSDSMRFPGRGGGQVLAPGGGLVDLAGQVLQGGQVAGQGADLVGQVLVGAGVGLVVGGQPFQVVPDADQGGVGGREGGVQVADPSGQGVQVPGRAVADEPGQVAQQGPVGVAGADLGGLAGGVLPLNCGQCRGGGLGRGRVHQAGVQPGPPGGDGTGWVPASRVRAVAVVAV